MRVLIFILIFVLSMFGCKRGNENGGQPDKNKASITEEIQSIPFGKLNKKGLEFYRRGEYEKAALAFRRASGYNSYEDNGDASFYPYALFNYACVRSIQYGKGKYDNYNEIMTFLSWAVDHDVKWLNKSRKDKDFDSIRNTERFQQLLIRSDLRYALINNKFEYFKSNLSKLKDIRAVDNFGHELLFYAVKEKNYKAIDLLLASGADINKGFHNGNSPLLYVYIAQTYIVYRREYYDMMKYLVSKGADVNVILNYTYDYAQFERYYVKIKGEPEDDNDGDHDDIGIWAGENLLSLALDNKYDKRIIQLLFNNNIRLDFNSGDRKTPFAVYLSRPVDQEELEKNNDAKAFIIKLLESHKDQENAKKIIKYINGEIKEEVWEKDFHVLKGELNSEIMEPYGDSSDKGYGFQVMGLYERAAYYYKIASSYEDYKDFKYIKLRSSDTYNYASVRSLQFGKGDYEDYDEIFTFLGLAFDYDIKLIDKANKDKNLDSIRNSEKFRQLLLFSNLRHALINNNTEYLIKNIDKLQEIRMRDSFGNELFFYAVKEENYKVIELLIEKGADINKGFHHGNSSMLYVYLAQTYGVYKRDYSDMIKYLASKGADVNVVLSKLYAYAQFEDYYAKMKGESLEDHRPDGFVAAGENLLSLSFSKKIEKRIIKILFEKNINLDLKLVDKRSAFVCIKRFRNDNENIIKEVKDFVIDLLKKHKDEKKAKKVIKYINGEIDYI